MGTVAVAQSEHSIRNFDFKIKAGSNIGGTAPMGIPAQIREIKTFNPLISLSIEANAIYWLSPKVGVFTGLRFENKGMTTQARVKEYNVRLKQDDGEVSGLFTGEVETKVKNGYLNIPLAFYFCWLSSFNVHFGGYYAYLLDPSFTGSVYDGYLRTGAVGQEYNMDMPKENPSYYDFSNELNKHDFGLHGGIEWNVTRHFLLSFDLNWSIHRIFPKSFTGMNIAMYNVYGNLAFGYKF
ncbi:membrane protein [Bacteroidia bacterium]|nr:membrane protein [Bacteroidia bacterium]